MIKSGLSDAESSAAISFTNTKTFLSDRSNEWQQTLSLKGPIWWDSENRRPGSAFTSADKHEESSTTFLHINDTWSKLGFDLFLTQNNQKRIERQLETVKKKRNKKTFSSFLMCFGKENDLNVQFQSKHVFLFCCYTFETTQGHWQKMPRKYNITKKKKPPKAITLSYSTDKRKEVNTLNRYLF